MGPSNKPMGKVLANPASPLFAAATSMTRPPANEPVRVSAGRRSVVPLWAAGMLLVALGGITGCAVTRDPMNEGRQAFFQGDLEMAQSHFVSVADDDRRWAAAANLDLAIAQLAAGEPAEAEHLLREARDAFDQQPKFNPLTETHALLTDDTKRTYSAAGYEQVMLRAMLSMCSLAKDGSDAESYAMQAQMRQTELAQQAEERGLKVQKAFQPVALAPYLRGVLRESTHHDYDDAAKAYQLVSLWQPSFSPAEGDFQRASEGLHCQPGNGVLYVFACVGRGPVLEEQVAQTTSDALRIASLAVDSASGQTALPRISSVPIPAVVIPASPAFGVGVRVNDQPAAATATLTDVAQLALAQSEAERPWTIARAVMRRVAKETAIKTTTNALNMDGQAAGIVAFAAGSVWESREKADLRCWGLLPREIQVARIELPAGAHKIDLQVLGSQALPIGPAATQHVVIRDGGNSYLLVFAPAEKIVAAVQQQSTY